MITALIQDFINLYRVIHRRSYEETIMNINWGSCGVLAMCVGNVLSARGYRPKVWSNCLHMYLELDGVFYDSLCPEGYPGSVEDYWLLSEAKYRSDPIEMELGLESNSGYHDNRRDCLVARAWYHRYELPEPKFIKNHLSGLVGRENKRYWRRLKQAMALPVHTGGAIPHNIYPMTHYWHGEWEEPVRPLKLRPVPHSVDQWKRLFKDYRLYGTPLTKL